MIIIFIDFTNFWLTKLTFFLKTNVIYVTLFEKGFPVF
jgi:hypothetical protein